MDPEAIRSPTGGLTQARPGTSILLYDGVCALCNWSVRFVLKRDRADRFRFVSLQSPFAQHVLSRHGKEPRQLDTMYLLVDYQQASERLLAKAAAVLHTLDALGGIWRLSGIVRLLPTFILDRAYDVVVKHRYGWFGRYDSCPIPAPEVRHKFLQVE